MNGWEALVFLLLMLYNMSVAAVYGFDKQQARRIAKKKKGNRVREKTMLLLAACMGGTGAFIGMRLYHHKTKKKRFRVLVPLFMGLQLLLLGGYMVYRLWL